MEYLFQGIDKQLLLVVNNSHSFAGYGCENNIEVECACALGNTGLKPFDQIGKKVYTTVWNRAIMVGGGNVKR